MRLRERNLVNACMIMDIKLKYMMNYLKVPMKEECDGVCTYDIYNLKLNHGVV